MIKGFRTNFKFLHKPWNISSFVPQKANASHNIRFKHDQVWSITRITEKINYYNYFHRHTLFLQISLSVFLDLLGQTFL